MPADSNGSPLSREWPGVGALDLEDILNELRSRASDARRSQERLSDLLEAVVAVSADLHLAEVLSRIVESAIALVEARYGALGVIEDDGEHLREFITKGVTDEERALIGDLPRGHGVLGLLIREPHPRRLRDISQHPDSFGFPPHHPPMHSFLGVPIRIRDQVFGNLYMAEKLGASEFTEEDEAILVALAAAASVAIDNARMYDSGQRRRQWVEAIGEVTKILLEREDEDAAVRLITSQVGRLAGASHVVLALLDEADTLVVRDVCRLDRGGDDGDSRVHSAALPPGSRMPLSGDRWALTREDGQAHPIVVTWRDTAPLTDVEATLVDDIRRVGGAPAKGEVAMVPLSAGRGTLGVLGVAWSETTEPSPEKTLPAIAEYAGQAALALLTGRAQRDRSRMRLLDDRDRIARDMHDHVIQRLFATGLSLQSAGRVAQHPMVQGRLDEAVDELDIAIKEIRHAIFELHQPLPDRSLEEDLHDLASSFERGLGFSPTLLVEGATWRIDSVLRSDVMAVVREGLSNVVRHAQASRADVHLHVDGQHVAIDIADDGVGLGNRGPRSGLANLGDRASTASGTFDVRAGDPSGTVLSWRVPLDSR